MIETTTSWYPLLQTWIADFKVVTCNTNPNGHSKFQAVTIVIITCVYIFTDIQYITIIKMITYIRISRYINTYIYSFLPTFLLGGRYIHGVFFSEVQEFTDEVRGIFRLHPDGSANKMGSFFEWYKIPAKRIHKNQTYGRLFQLSTPLKNMSQKWVHLPQFSGWKKK